MSLGPSEPGPRWGQEIHLHLFGPLTYGFSLVNELWPLRKLEGNGLTQPW